MGVLNVTPDSFSDGGLWEEPGAAVAHAHEMWEAGADIVDVGAESTRPGSTRITPVEEWRRLGPVLLQLARSGMTISVDTIHAETARRAADLGVAYINDISGGSFDPELAEVVAAAGTKFIVQHWRGFPGDPELNLDYGDPSLDALAETLAQVRRAEEKGVDAAQIIIDPGLGFALTGRQSWQIVNKLKPWVASGYPVLVGPSRKRFIRERYGEDVETGTLEVVRRCWEEGVWGVRVHDVGRTGQLVRDLEAQMEGEG